MPAVPRVAPGPPPPVADPAAVDLLRADLTGAGFTVDGVAELLGPVAANALHREQDVPAALVTSAALAGPSPDPRAVLTHAFLLGRPVTRGALDSALPTLGAAGAVRLGLARAAGEQDEDEVRAVVDLRPYAAADAAGDVHWWLASDLGELQTGHALAPDHVLGAGGASTTLAQVTIRTPRERVLDLGTGCGVQALHASRHARSVVGTDISRRALGFAAFNTLLDLGPDGASTVELREGSLLAPVRGEEFGLVVSNPPFVITPHATNPHGRPRPGEAGAVAGRTASGIPDYEYRDGGRAGDDLVHELVAGVGDVLAPGGVAQLLGNWEHRRGEPWTERVGAWLDEALDGTGIDGWVIERELLDPAEYAETWIRDGGTTRDRDPAAWAAAYAAWLDDLASRDVEGVGFGMILLRRPDPAGPAGGRRTLRRLEELHGGVVQPLGAHLADCLAAHDALTALGPVGSGQADVALAAAHLVTAPDVTEERYLRPGAADPDVVLLRQGVGFQRSVRASTGLAALVGACDGELSVGQIVAAIAALLGVDADALAAELAPEVRGMVGDGFLTFAD